MLTATGAEPHRVICGELGSGTNGAGCRLLKIKEMQVTIDKKGEENRLGRGVK